MNLKLAFVLVVTTNICAADPWYGQQHRTTDCCQTDPRPQSGWSSTSEDYMPETQHLDGFSPEGLDLTGDLRKQFAYVVANDARYKNVVCSPVSALLPLGTLSFGASGDTFDEIARAVGARNEDEISMGFLNLLKGLEEITGITLKIASRIYLDVKQQLKRRFLRKTKRVFKSSVEKVDLENGMEAAQTINYWVNVLTDGKISDLVNPSEVRGSELVLVNAIYFSGRWQNKFHDARHQSFIGPHGKKTVNMMDTTGHFDYYECPILDAQIVSIPFENNKVRMVLVVPKKINGLGPIAEQLTYAPEKLSEAINMMGTKHVAIELPRFRIESELDLGDIYRKLGLQNLMSFSPEFNKIVQSLTSLRIGTAKQKAFIEVDENGTTAAAASAVAMVMMSVMPSPIEATVIANRPFMFYILAGNQQLFFGTVSDPEYHE